MSLTAEEEDRLNTILQAADADRGRLNAWEKNFLDDHIRRYDDEGSNIVVTRKQWDVLEKIADRVGA